MSNTKKYLAEGIGTMVLVLFGCGVAVATGCEGNAGIVATALAFGLAIVAVAYSIGGISGCHLNPAVSFAMWMTKRMTGWECLGYMLSQVIGGWIAADIIALFFGSFRNLGGNAVQKAITGTYGNVGGLFIGLCVEIVLTFLFVLTVLGVSAGKEHKAFAGLAIGLSLTLTHLLGIRLTGTSVNPARSLGPAVMEMFSGNFTAMSQIWIFLIGPFIGAAVAAYVYAAWFSQEES